LKGEEMFNYERMAELIREKGIEQKTVAEAVGVSEQAVSYFVRGLKSPSIEVLSRIAKVLDVPAAELIKE
jgi:repressor LexA